MLRELYQYIPGVRDDGGFGKAGRAARVDVHELVTVAALILDDRWHTRRVSQEVAELLLLQSVRWGVRVVRQPVQRQFRVQLRRDVLYGWKYIKKKP